MKAFCALCCPNATNPLMSCFCFVPFSLRRNVKQMKLRTELWLHLRQWLGFWDLYSYDLYKIDLFYVVSSCPWSFMARFIISDPVFPQASSKCNNIYLPLRHPLIFYYITMHQWERESEQYPSPPASRPPIYARKPAFPEFPVVLIGVFPPFDAFMDKEEALERLSTRSWNIAVSI